MLNLKIFTQNLLLTSFFVLAIIIAVFNCGQELNPIPMPTGQIENPAGDSFFIQITPRFTGADGIDFSDLTDIAITNSNSSILVVDRGNNRVVEVDLAGRLRTNITGLEAPIGVAQDNNGNIYVAESLSRQVKVFSSSGSLLRSFTATDLNEISSIAVDSEGRIFLTDPGVPDAEQFLSNRLNLYSNDGAFIIRVAEGTPTFGGAGSITNGRGLFVAEIDGKEIVFYADTDKARVQNVEFIPPGTVNVLGLFSGNPISSFSGGDPTAFNQPYDVYSNVLTDGRDIYIADKGNDRILIFNDNGSPFFVIEDNDSFTEPVAVAVHVDITTDVETVFVAAKNSVVRYRPNYKIDLGF